MAQFNPAVLIPEIGAYDLCNPYCNMNHLASIIFTQRNTLFYIQVKDNSERNYASTGTARCAAALSYMGVALVSFVDKIHRLSHFSSIFQFHSPKHLYHTFYPLNSAELPSTTLLFPKDLDLLLWSCFASSVLTREL